MAYTTIMKYGDYEFSPVPKFSLEKEFTKAGDGTIIGTVHSFTLAGTLIPGLSPGPYPAASDKAFGSFSGVVTLQEQLREAFKEEGKLFTISTSGKDGTFDSFRSYPRINSFGVDEHEQNWYQQGPYSISLEYDVSPQRENGERKQHILLYSISICIVYMYIHVSVCVCVYIDVIYIYR